MKKIFTSLFLIFFVFTLKAQVYNQTTVLATYSAPSGGAFGPVNLTGTPPQPIGPGTLTFYYRGDLDSPTGGEFFEVFDENNNLIGQSLSTGQCATFFDSTSFTVSAADIAQWAANGQITFSFNAGTGVNGSTLCGQPSGAYVKLKYQFQSGGNFCPGPFGLNVTNVDTSSLTFGWTSGGSPVANIQFGLAGFSLGNGNIIPNITTNPFTINGLTKGVTYDIYIQDSCLNTNNASFWSGPLRVTIPIAATYYQGFDNVTVPNLPFGWLQLIHNVSTTSLPSAITSIGNLTNEPVPQSLPNMGRFDIIFGTSTINNDTVFLLSPPVFDLATGKNRVRFSAASPGPQFMEVGIITDPNDKGSFISLETVGPLTSNWEEFSVNVVNYTGPIARLAFKYYGTLNSSDGYIDDIYWEPIPEHEIGVTGFDSPSNPIILGNQSVAVSIKNYGTDSLATAQIGWDVNGALQTPFNLGLTGTNRLAVNQSANNIVIGNFNFSNSLSVVRSWTSNPNGFQDEIPSNDTAAAIFCTGLSGTYTAGNPGDDFPKIEYVFEALNSCGLVGPTKVLVSPGNYLVNEELSNISGLGVNSLTFVGDSASNTLFTTAGSGTNIATILLDNVSNVHFKRLTLQNESTNLGRCIQIRNQCNNITIDSCIMVATNPLLTAGLQVVGVFMGPSITSNFTEGDPGKNITVSNCEFFNLEQAVQVEAAFNTPAKNIRVLDNFITSGLDGAIRIDNVDSTYIIGNTIEQMGLATSDGISVEDLRTFWINENEIYLGGDGILLFRANDTAGVVGELINNIISGGFNGISLQNSASSQILHNSIESNPALNLNNAQSVDCRNNIFIADQGLAFNAFNASFTILDYNIYKTNGANIASNNGGTITDFASFQAALPLYNINSLNGDPLFLSPIDFRIVYGQLANDAGDSTVNVFTDIDGEVRPASGSTRPDIGADEYTPPAYDLGLNRLLSQNGFCFSDTDSVSFEITNYGLNNLDFSVDSFELFWEITGPNNQSGSMVINADTLNVGDTATIWLNTTIDFSNYGTYLLTAYIVADFDSTALNDSIIERPINVPTLIDASGDTTIVYPGGFANLKATSPILNNVLISEIVQFKTGQGQTNPYPNYLPTGDFDMAEIANVSTTAADFSNYSFEMYDGNGLMFSYTIPNNVVVAPFDVLLLGFASFGNQPANNLYWMNGVNTSSNVQNGYILKDGTGAIVDVVATNGFTFPASSGVTSNDWSGNLASSSGLAGVFRTGTDNDVATDWNLASATNTMSIGTYNPGLDTVPSASLNWLLDTNLVDTVANITIGPLNVNGVYNYVASIQSQCGIVYDTVVVNVNIPYPDTGLVDVVVDSIGISSDLLCNATSTNVKMYLTNVGSDTVYFIPAGYTLNGGTAVSEIIIDTLYPNLQKEIGFSTAASLTSNGVQNLKAWVVILGDTILINDTNSTVFNNRNIPATPVASSDTNYCPGSQVQNIFATGSGGVLNWYSSSIVDTSNFISSGDTLVPLTNSGASSYYVFETDTFGCISNPDTVVVGIFGYPNAFAGPNTSVCIGSTKTLIASGGVSYVWSNGTQSAINSVTPLVPTTYSVTVTDANGCVAADTIDVAIDTLPIVSLSLFNNLCLNDPAFSLSGGIPSGGIFSGASVNNGQFLPSTAGIGPDTIIYTFTAPNGCSNSAKQAIFVDTLPNVTFGSLTPVCANGAPFSLTGGSPAGGFYSGSGVTSGIFNPSQAGGAGNKFLSYTYSDGNGCSNTATAIQTTLAAPTVTLSTFPAICEDYFPFALTGGKPVGGTYSGNGIANDTLFPATAGAGNIAIQYQFTDNNGCSAKANRNITIDAKPAKPKILIYGSDSLLADVNAPLYQWYFEGQVYPEVTKVIYAQLSGFYQVEAINGTCSSERADEYYFEVTSVGEKAVNSDFKVYPNPTNGLIFIENFGQTKIESVSIMSIDGKQVYVENFENAEYQRTLNFSKLNSGIYFLSITEEGGKLSRYRIVKQ